MSPIPTSNASLKLRSEAAAVLSVIERATASKDVEIEKLEKLLDMQERIMSKGAETAFNTAMAQMQAKLPIIAERGAIVIEGQVVGYYAKFEDINEAVKPILQRYGFSVSFKTDTTGGVVKVTGILAHRDGHRETTDIVLPVDLSGKKNPVQAVGSSVSYGKRYAIEALLNLTSRGQDDDSRGTVDPGPEPDAEGKLQLEACQSREELQVAWKALSTSQRKTLQQVKDSCKVHIEALRKGGVA